MPQTDHRDYPKPAAVDDFPVPSALRIDVKRSSHRRTALLLGVLHMALSTAAYHAGVSPGRLGGLGHWDGVWQTIPTELLLEHPLQSIWHLHAQPPAYACWGWILLKIGGVGGFPFLLRLAHILLGGITVGVTFRLILAMTGRVRWALAGGLIMLFNPSLIYFQAYILYEMLLIGLLTTSAWLLWRLLTFDCRRHLFLWVVVLNIVVLTRSLYHVVFLVCGLLFALPAWKSLGLRKSLLIMFVALVPSGSWYIKNLNQYGFCGPSSWYGLGWFKTAASMYAHEDLNRLKDHGIIDAWVLKDPYQGEVSDAIQLFPPSGTGVAILNRMDFHHASIPQLSRAYAVNALQLIRHQPSMYLRAVHDGYMRFCRPSSTFHHLDPLGGILFWEGVYNLLFSGQGVVRSTIPTGWREQYSMIYFIFTIFGHELRNAEERVMYE